MEETVEPVKVSVVIPSLYEVDGEYLKLCVESLRSTTDWDIIVVTNGSSHKPKLDHIRGITVHLHTTGQGQCLAVNAGAQIVNPSTKILMVSNSDMYYADGWNKSLNLLLQEDLDKIPKCFSPNLIEPVNNAGSAPPFLKFDGGLELKDLKVTEIYDFIAQEGAKSPDDEAGFNLPFFINMDLWRLIGGYDKNYDPWGSNSDTDLQTKINLAGVTPQRLRDVLVYHFSNKSGTFDGSHQEAWQHNWDYFDKKWGFNRDQLGSDVWYNERMLPEDPSVIKYQPEWAGKYGKD